MVIDFFTFLSVEKCRCSLFQRLIVKYSQYSSKWWLYIQAITEILHWILLINSDCIERQLQFNCLLINYAFSSSAIVKNFYTIPRSFWKCLIKFKTVLKSHIFFIAACQIYSNSAQSRCMNQILAREGKRWIEMLISRKVIENVPFVVWYLVMLIKFPWKKKSVKSTVEMKIPNRVRGGVSSFHVAIHVWS